MASADSQLLEVRHTTFNGPNMVHPLSPPRGGSPTFSFKHLVCTPEHDVVSLGPLLLESSPSVLEDASRAQKLRTTLDGFKRSKFFFMIIEFIEAHERMTRR